MTADEDVTVVTSEQIDEGLLRMLQRLGLTFEELHQQALDDRFVSERARLTWFAIGTLGPTS